MKYLILILTLLNICSCSNKTNDSTSVNLKIDTNLYKDNSLKSDTVWTTTFKLPECPFTIKNAITDIKNDSMKIVLHGGFTGFGDIDSIRSEQFQKKYNVKFEYLGCIRIWDIKNEDTYGYNDEIFKYLTKSYGDEVRKEYKNIWK